MLERFFRWIAGPVLVCSSLVLAAATPSPPPLPPPAPAAPTGGRIPIVVVYPFEVQTGADPKIGMAIAQILAQEMTAAGEISVPPVPQGIKRADFLAHAQSAHADFYISGYVTPVGDSAAVVEQVVSVESGVILFSQTAQVSTVADVASQSLLARTQILTFFGRGTQPVQAQSANTPAPTSSNGAQLPLRGIASIVDSVFKHRPAHTPSPGPTSKPLRGVIVAPIAASGSVAAGDLSNAAHELYFALSRHFTTQMSAISSTDVVRSADQICGANRNNTIAGGTLQVSSAHRGRQDVTFNLAVSTCFGAILEREVGKGSSVKNAVDAAVAAYATAHPDNS